jgi:hypothetical protein
MKWANTSSTSDILAHRQTDNIKPRLNFAYSKSRGVQFEIKRNICFCISAPFKSLIHSYMGRDTERDEKEEEKE